MQLTVTVKTILPEYSSVSVKEIQGEDDTRWSTHGNLFVQLRTMTDKAGCLLEYGFLNDPRLEAKNAKGGYLNRNFSVPIVFP